MKNWKLFSITALLFVCLGFGIYLFYWIERPMYAIEQIWWSVRNGNVIQFTQYVDMDSVYGKAYDKYIEKLIKDNIKLFQGTRQQPARTSEKMALYLMRSFRSNVVDELKKATITNIKQRKAKAMGELPMHHPGKGLPELFTKLITTIAVENDLYNLQFQSADVEMIDNRTAQGYVILKNEKPDSEFRINFIMKKYARWKVTEITNLDEIMSRVVKNPINVEDLF